MKAAQVCRILHYTPHECLQRAVNSGGAWIKQYGYAIPSSCLLCFNSTPNSLDGLFGRAVLMCCLFGRGMSARWCSETEKNMRISRRARFNLCPSDEYTSTGPLPEGTQVCTADGVGASGAR